MINEECKRFLATSPVIIRSASKATWSKSLKGMELASFPLLFNSVCLTSATIFSTRWTRWLISSTRTIAATQINKETKEMGETNFAEQLCNSTQWEWSLFLDIVKRCHTLAPFKRCGQLSNMMHASRPIPEIWLWESVLPKSNTVSNSSGQTSGRGKTNKRFMVAWLSFAFPLLIFILGLAFNYIIVQLKSYNAAYSTVPWFNSLLHSRF